MKKIGNYIFIYRVVSESGAFVSAWVLEKQQAKKIAEEVLESPIFGGDKYRIEESTLIL